MTETYKEFVYRKMRDVLGENDGQVTDFIIRAWISDHSGYLENIGATVTDWRESNEINSRGTGRR